MNVLKSLRLTMVRSVAVVGLAGWAAGCSSDVARFDDGFYTGAVPQASTPTASAANQPYPGAVDQMRTGGIGEQSRFGMPDYGKGPDGAARASTQSTQSVQRHMLPPPPAPNDSRAQPRFAATPTPPSASSAPATRGLPPSTLGDQAADLNKPQRAAKAADVTVESGDTLLSIARRTGVSVSDIRAANDLSGDTIRVGQTLVVPGAKAGTTRVASVEAKPAVHTAEAVRPKHRPAAKSPAPEPYTSPKVAEKAGRPSTEVASKQSRPKTTVGEEVESKVAAIPPDATGISQFRWPVQGRVVSRFGEKVGSRRNDGLNISVPRGTPVKAAENGIVIYAGDGLKEFGNTVLVKHDGGLVTVYGHADSIAVERGAKVRRGQVIAKSGMSGDTDIPILHFEVRKNSAPVDPTKYLQ